MISGGYRCPLYDDDAAVTTTDLGSDQATHQLGQCPGDRWHLDEVFVKINGKQHYLWRAVDQHGNVLDVLVQSHRNAQAAERFFRKLLTGLQRVPRVIVTDKLASYGVAHRRAMPSVEHRRSKYLKTAPRTRITDQAA